MYGPNNWASKYMEQKLIETKVHNILAIKQVSNVKGAKICSMFSAHNWNKLENNNKDLWKVLNILKHSEILLNNQRINEETTSGVKKIF